MNIALRVFWSNQPMPVHQKITHPDLILNVPFGHVLTLKTGGSVQSVNQKTGHVVLNAIDVGADSVGAAKNVFDELFPKIESAQRLAETNQLNISKKADQLDLEQTNQQVELNRLSLLNKADLTALAMLSTLIDTKADQNYVNQQIANLLNGDQEMIASIQEISHALQQNEDLLEALDYTVANRVRFDVASQALTALQKSNARINIGAEEVGTAALLIAQITTATIGAATAAQGKKADTALQSADVAPVALSGLFSSLGGQSKIFDVVFSAYALGANSVISATDSLGQMLGKLQAQIDALKSGGAVWVPASSIGVFNDNTFSFAKSMDGKFTSQIEFARIDGLLWIRGSFYVKVAKQDTVVTIQDDRYKCLIGQDYMGATVFSVLHTVQDRRDSTGNFSFRSTNRVYDSASAVGVDQLIIMNTALNASDILSIYIKPQPIGILINP